MRWYFFFFLISGFCGILYELVWLRLAMAQYGVTTPIVSIVLSAFMGGLGIGSLGCRDAAPALRHKNFLSALVAVCRIGTTDRHFCPGCSW